MQTIRAIILLLFVTVSARAVNLLPNSSFECGAGNGWIEWQTANSAVLGEAGRTAWGNLEFINGLLTNDAFHGRYSMRVPVGPRLQSRAIWLTNGTYTVSFYGRGTVAMPFGIINGSGLPGTGLPVNNAALTGTWTQFSAQFVADSNAFYWVKFGYTLAPAQVDAVQVEPGSSVSAYAPQYPVELALSCDNTNSMWFSGDAAAFTMNFWNNGPASLVAARYNVTDVWNSNVFSGTTLVSLSDGTNTSQSVTLPSRTGWFRVTAQAGTSQDEMAMVVYPYLSNITTSVSGDWLGGHGHISPFHVNREILANRKWTRALSPNIIASRWNFLQPNSISQWVFNPVAFTNYAAEGQNIVCPLTSQDGYWPHWATNVDGTASMSAYSNYCWRLVTEVVGLGLTNTYFELWNEPFQSGPVTPINLQLATNYATLMTYGIWGITQAFPQAKIIAIGGAFGAGEWAEEAWTNISAASQAAVTVISTHMYPQDNSSDPNEGEYEASHYSNPGGWILRFGSIRPVWNTESGTYDTGPIVGLNGMWPAAYNVQSSPAIEATRNELMSRQLSSLVRVLTEALRCIGYTFEKYFYYDSRYFNDASFQGIQPYPADYRQVDRPCVVSLSVAASMVKAGLGPITNTTTGPYMETYLFTNALGHAVVAAWSADRRNRTLTLTNSNYKLVDAMANQIQTNSLTARICRVPRYFVSSTLTTAQLSNMVVNASAVIVADVLPPQISLDVYPPGVWNGQANAQLFKWTALDDTATAWITDTTATNVMYRWKLDGGSYGSYSQSNHVWIPNLASGAHTFYVSARDASGNVSEATFGSVPDASQLNVSGTLTVTGNLTIGP